MMIFEIFCEPKPVRKTQWGKGKVWNPSKQYEETIAWQIRPFAPKEPISGPVAVDMTFYMPIPKGTPALKRKQMLAGIIHHVKRPDRDNLAYPVTNAMKNIIYEDDSQIVMGDTKKLYGEVPKIVIRVREL
jgi:Holliday junction resolvase RusA-like endonuclease